MKLLRWKDLNDTQKNSCLKKICTGAAVLFLIILILLLMKCESCSTESKKHRDFSDGKGHSYGEKLSGAELFNDEYGKDAEEYSLIQQDEDIDNEILAENQIELESESNVDTEIEKDSETDEEGF